MPLALMQTILLTDVRIAVETLQRPKFGCASWDPGELAKTVQIVNKQHTGEFECPADILISCLRGSSVFGPGLFARDSTEDRLEQLFGHLFEVFALKNYFEERQSPGWLRDYFSEWILSRMLACESHLINYFCDRMETVAASFTPYGARPPFDHESANVAALKQQACLALAACSGAFF